MNSRERVLAAFRHETPDFTPIDYFDTVEIRTALFQHFGVDTEDALRRRLGTDIHYVRPPYTGPELPVLADGATTDIWGVGRKPMPNEYGEYDEVVSLPFADWTDVAQVDAYPWPNPDHFDYDVIPAFCRAHPDKAIGAGGFGIQDFINGISFGRGVEQVLIDIALEDPVYLAIVEKRQRFFMAQVERMLDAGQGRVDFVLCGDDFGSQRGPLISPEKFDLLFAARKKELFDLIHSYGAFVSHHSCGSTRLLIPRFIEIGMDGLQTIQSQAEGMDPYGLKRDFGKHLLFHGAVDVQGWLQKASREDIKNEINRLMDEVGRDGGYILSPSHCIQPDTPLENVLAVYEAANARRR